jgi:hypothetical protein
MGFLVGNINSANCGKPKKIVEQAPRMKIVGSKEFLLGLIIQNIPKTAAIRKNASPITLKIFVFSLMPNANLFKVLLLCMFIFCRC